ncbi:MAG: tetratricopeptide repeat protein [Acidobacteriota bacterium]
MIGQTLGHYRVLEEIGAGGMGVVYRAWDDRLERSVALKLLPAGSLADDADRQRFRREALALSRLNHPNIETVHDFDTDRGVDFLVTEYVAGSTLRERLHDPLSVAQFVELAEQCAEALAAAHRQGIVHLDVKPENVMLTPDGRVKVLDFGIARELRRGGPDATTAGGSTTGDESCGGTVGYTAPEVLLRGDVDGRADIFSLGVVFYEALARRHPFQLSSLAGTVARVLNDTPAPVDTHNPEIPADLGRMVSRMLVKDPAARYASAAALAAELRGMRRGPAGSGDEASAAPRAVGLRRGAWLGAAALLVLAAGAVPGIRRTVGRWLGLGATADRYLAVLAFDPGADDPRGEAFGKGLADTLTARLTRLTASHGLQIAPPSEALKLESPTLDLVQKKLGADLALSGGLQRSGERIRIAIHLADVHSRTQLGAETIDGTLADPFSLEDRVVDAAVRILKVELSPRELEPPRRRGTTIAGAYEYYLQGRGYLRGYDKEVRVDSAIDVFGRSLAADPGYAGAHAGIGQAYWYKFDHTKDPAWLERASASCGEAVRLDRADAEGHICLGMVHRARGRYADAVAEFDRATRLDAANEEAFRWLGRGYERLGRVADAEEAYRKAIVLRPHYWAGYNSLGVLYYGSGQYAKAEDMFRQVVSLAPDSSRGLSNLGVIYQVQGRYRDAIPVLERSIEIDPDETAYSNLGAAHVMLRDFDRAVAIYREAIATGHAAYYIWANLGEAYDLGGGERERAGSAYRSAVELAEGELRVNPRDLEVIADLAKYHAVLGEREAAHRFLSGSLRRRALSAEQEFTVALAYKHLGALDEALHWLERALRDGYSRQWVRDTPVLDDLRELPGFARLVESELVSSANR